MCYFILLYNSIFCAIFFFFYPSIFCTFSAMTSRIVYFCEVQLFPFLSKLNVIVMILKCVYPFIWPFLVCDYFQISFIRFMGFNHHIFITMYYNVNCIFCIYHIKSLFLKLLHRDSYQRFKWCCLFYF